MSFPSAPPVGAPRVWSPPAPTLRPLSSGLPLYLHAEPLLPLVSLRIQVPVGSADDPAAGWGRAALLAAMVQEGAGDLDSLERAAALDRLAARFAVIPGRDFTTVALEVHRNRLEEALPLVADAILRPRFAAEDWERVQRRHLGSLRQGLDNNSMVAAAVTARVVLGEAHPYGHPAQGLIDSIAAATIADVVALWESGFHSGGAAAVMVGDIDEPGILALEHALAGWGPRSPTPKRWPVAAPRPGAWFVDSPGSAQTVIRVAQPGVSGPDPRRFAADLARVVLGGSFTSRLNQKLREEKGYTYGARVALSEFAHGGIATASASVQGDATADALVDLLAVLAAARDHGFTPIEVDRARAQALTDLVEAAESRASLSGTYTQEIEAGRDPLRLRHTGEAVMAVTSEEMTAATRAWLDPDQASLILVGDAASALPALAALGFRDWKRLDREGNAI